MHRAICPGNFPRMSASTAKMRVVWRLVQPARSCARNSAACTSSRTFATAAHTAWSHAPLAWWSAIRSDGRAFKCTFCYDRQIDGLKPACATACPTESIKFGDLDKLRDEAHARVEKLKEKGIDDARLYDPVHTSVGGIHAFFIVRGDPKTYNLPPNPEVPTVYLRKGWTGAAIAAGLMLGGALFAFLGGRSR